MKTEQLRDPAQSRFEALDPAQLGGLCDAERDVIARTVVAHGPALIRRGYVERLADRATRVGALAAAAVLVLLVTSRQPDTKTSLPPPARPATVPDHTRLALREGTPTREDLRPSSEGGGVDAPSPQSTRSVSLASSTSLSLVESETVVRTLPSSTADTASAGAVSAQRVRTGKSLPAAGAAARSVVSAAQQLAWAEILWRRGDRDAARLAFRAAARDSGPIGEAAWVRLARLELSSGSGQRALAALRACKARAQHGTLRPEALWLEAQALARTGRGNEAVEVAEILLRDYPSSPQATAARDVVAKERAR